MYVNPLLARLLGTSPTAGAGGQPSMFSLLGYQPFRPTAAAPFVRKPYEPQRFPAPIIAAPPAPAPATVTPAQVQNVIGSVLGGDPGGTTDGDTSAAGTAGDDGGAAGAATGDPGGSGGADPDSGPAAGAGDPSNGGDGTGGGGGDGGCHVYTELLRQGLIRPRELGVIVRYHRRLQDPRDYAGYCRWSLPAARLMRRSAIFTRLVALPLARTYLERKRWRLGMRKTPPRGFLTEILWDGINRLAGLRADALPPGTAGAVVAGGQEGAP